MWFRRKKRVLRPSSTSKRLVREIKKQIDLPGEPNDYVVKRTYAGYNQRSEGAWSWYLMPYDENKANLRVDLGSQYPVVDLLIHGFTITPHIGAYHLDVIEPQHLDTLNGKTACGVLIHENKKTFIPTEVTCKRCLRKHNAALK